MIPVYEPYIPVSSEKYVQEAMKSTWISSLGKYVDEAAAKLAEICECKYVLLTNNGTAATHLVTRSLAKFRPDVKKILVPSACYVAAYNSLVYDGRDWEVECVDVSLDTWNMDIQGVNEGDAIFAVHNLGNIINVPRLKNKFGCVIIEDNCEGFFGTYEGAPAGSKSLCSSLSFFGNKNVTCGEGGAFLTNDKDIYEFATKLRGQGQSAERYIHDEMGYNYRMTNIQAAILLGQLENIDYVFGNKKRVFDRYKVNLSNTPGLSLQREEEDTTHSMWMLGGRFHGLSSYREAAEYFAAVGIDTRPMFYSFKKHRYLNFTGSDQLATLLNNEVVIFPSSPALRDEEIDYICEHIVEFSKQVERK